MWMIMKKNMSFFAGYLLAVLLIAVCIWIFAGKTGNPIFVVICGMLQFLFILGSALFNEQYEEKHKGYAFLEILPLKTIDIVGAKFLLVLAGASTLTGILISFYSQAPVQLNEFLRIRSYFLLCGSLSIITCAGIYIGIFSIGYTRFVIVLLTLTTALGLVPMVILNVYRTRMDEMIQRILNWLQNINWMLQIPLVLALFFAIMLIAVRIRDRRPAEQL